MRIMIGKALKHFYMLGKSNIMLTWTYSIVLNIKEKHNCKPVSYTSYTHIVEIPTNKGANSYKLEFSKILVGLF